MIVLRLKRKLIQIRPYIESGLNLENLQEPWQKGYRQRPKELETGRGKPLLLQLRFITEWSNKVSSRCQAGSLNHCIAPFYWVSLDGNGLTPVTYGSSITLAFSYFNLPAVPIRELRLSSTSDCVALLQLVLCHYRNTAQLSFCLSRTSRLVQ